MGSKKKKGKSSSGNSVASAALAIERTHNVGQSGLLDEFIAWSRQHARDKQLFDGQVFSADETVAQLICLPMPGLAPRFLVQSDGWPLGRFTLIDGVQESCKSAFMHEIGTWHRNLGGHYHVIETEHKDGSELRHSFFNYDSNAWSLTKVGSQDAWNQAFFFWIKQFKNAMDGYDREMTEDELKKEAQREARKQKEEEDGGIIKQPKYRKNEKPPTKKVKVAGAGRRAPVCLGVDSISAVVIDSIADEMLKTGMPELNHPQGARLLSDFFKVAPKQLSGYPISFMAVSHLREKPIPHSFKKERITTGGAAPKFQMTTEIEMQRTKDDESHRSHPEFGEIHSISLKLIVRKNSLAGHEFINTEMVWYKDPYDLDPRTRERRQKSYFDWATASIELLIDCSAAGDAGKGFSGGRARQVRELIDIHKDSDKRKMWSKTLGIGKDDQLSYFEAGQVLERKIQADSEFRHQLYELLGIRQRRLFEPGVEYLQQIEKHHNDITSAAIAHSARISEAAAATGGTPLPEDMGGEKNVAE